MRGCEHRHFIYFARMRDGSIKIGSSTNVPSRLNALKADLLHIIEGSTFRETALHFLLREANVGGELFADGAVIRAFIEKARLGDYSGLISDVPRIDLRLQHCAIRHKAHAHRPFRDMREATGLTVDDVSNGADVAVSTAASADSQSAPHFLSGRLAQFIIGQVRQRGVFVDSHHLTGLFESELTGLLRPLVSQRRIAA